MNLPKNEEWITCPDVIELLFKLNALQRGDELVFASAGMRNDGDCFYPCDCEYYQQHRVASAFRGKRIVLVQTSTRSAAGEYWHYRLLDGTREGHPVGFIGETVMHPHRISAWRRPLTPKHKEET